MCSRKIGSVRLSPEEQARRAIAERRRREEEERRQREAALKQAHDLVELAAALRRKAAAAPAAGAVRKTSWPASSLAEPTANHAQQTVARRDRMFGFMHEMQAVLDDLPAEVVRARQARLTRIRGELRSIEACRDNNFTMHEPRLKALRGELYCAVADPAEIIERCVESVVALNSLRESIDERLPRVPTAEATFCARIRERIDELLETADLDRFEDDLGPLLHDGAALVARIDAAVSRNTDARYLRAAIAATLADLGYEAIELPSDLARTDDDQVFKTPSEGLVRFQLTRDLNFDAEYVHLTTSSTDLDAGEFAKAALNCQRWCEDAQLLSARLAEAGVSLNFESVIPPDRGGFAVIATDTPRNTTRNRNYRECVEADSEREQEDEYS